MPASRWVVFGRVPNDDDHAALLAARADLDVQRRELIADGDPALSLTATVDDRAKELVVSVGANGAVDEVRLSLCVIKRAAKAQLAPLALVAYALVVPGQLDEAWRPRLAGGTTPPAGEALDKQLRVHRLTDADHEIEHALRDGRDVVLMGDYGTGKTATATVHARRCEDEGYGIVWLDLTDPADGAESVLATLLESRRHDRYLVFADSVQANPTAFEGVLACVHRLRADYELQVQILATGWPRLIEGWRTPFKEFRKVRARNVEMIKQLVADSVVPSGVRGQVIELAGGDVHLAMDAVDYYGRHGLVPTWTDLQGEFTEDIEDDECRKALYWFASLGFFGLDAPAQAIRGRLAEEAVQRLVERGMLGYSDGRYAIASHARARLALRQALASWNAIACWGPPEHLAWEYLQRAGERVIRATLSRLDLVGISADPSAPFNASTRYLARAWDMFIQLGQALARRCKEDMTWADNVGAAIFAAQALAVMDHSEEWSEVAGFIRDRWKYDVPGVLPVPIGEPSRESADFDLIVGEMGKEDREPSRPPHVAAEPAGSIDINRFYGTWMLGALLGFEGAAIHSDQRRMDALLATAAKMITPEGYFYPRRVPWVTARTVLGLCLAGESYDSSKVVRRACDWLRRPASHGGPFDNGWHSGTGAWNSPEATTAMCLTALLRAGAPLTHEITTGLLWLLTREDHWARDGHEIDLALVLEAVLLGDDHQKVYQRVLALLAWAQDELTGHAGPISAHVPEAGLRAPFVAAQLASFVWATVTREYKALLRAMIIFDEPDHPTDEAEPPVGGASSPYLPDRGSSSDDNGAAPGDILVEPRPSLAAWQHALRQLDDWLLRHLRTRVNIVCNTPHGGASEVREAMERYRSHLQRSRMLAEQVEERTPRLILVELDKIGREVCKDAWPDLHVPTEHDEGGAG